MLKLYDFLPSGNSYKVRLLLSQLRIPYERIDVDILKGENRNPTFLARNPTGRIPLLEIAPQVCLSESNAIMCYLARGGALLPSDPLQYAQVLQWLFFEQYSHEPYIATSRYWIALLGKERQYRDELAKKRGPGCAALKIMEHHLAAHPFFVADRYSLADIGLYAYTHVAPEGGFELDPFPNILTWLDRVRSQPGHIDIHHIPAGA
ncbi:MAG: glutathione S-transferase family protein [Gammaproteobacteria bacterium]|jgi:glutathione S-transferase